MTVRPHADRAPAVSPARRAPLAALRPPAAVASLEPPGPHLAPASAARRDSDQAGGVCAAGHAGRARGLRMAENGSQRPAATRASFPRTTSTPGPMTRSSRSSGDPGRMRYTSLAHDVDQALQTSGRQASASRHARAALVACWTSSENAWPGSRVSTFSAAPAAIGSSR